MKEEEEEGWSVAQWIWVEEGNRLHSPALFFFSLLLLAPKVTQNKRDWHHVQIQRGGRKLKKGGWSSGICRRDVFTYSAVNFT